MTKNEPPDPEVTLEANSPNEKMTEDKITTPSMAVANDTTLNTEEVLKANSSNEELAQDETTNPSVAVADDIIPDTEEILNASSPNEDLAKDKTTTPSVAVADDKTNNTEDTAEVKEPHQHTHKVVIHSAQDTARVSTTTSPTAMMGDSTSREEPAQDKLSTSPATMAKDTTQEVVEAKKPEVKETAGCCTHTTQNVAEPEISNTKTVAQIDTSVKMEEIDVPETRDMLDDKAPKPEDPMSKPLCHSWTAETTWHIEKVRVSNAGDMVDVVVKDSGTAKTPTTKKFHLSDDKAPKPSASPFMSSVIPGTPFSKTPITPETPFKIPITQVPKLKTPKPEDLGRMPGPPPEDKGRMSPGPASEATGRMLGPTPEDTGRMSPGPTSEATGRMPGPEPAPRLQTADEVLELMSQTPLFMTSLDSTTADENPAIQALKALAYEGTRLEIATNFKEQGNEGAKNRSWLDAREFYNKAIAALGMSEHDLRVAQGDDNDQQESKPPGINLKAKDIKKEDRVVDVEEEERKERKLLEICHVNRALCNLEMSNYRMCIHDCAAALGLNDRNLKAFYRSASACLALDNLAEAHDACSRGQAIDPSNASFEELMEQILEREQVLLDREIRQRRREEMRVSMGQTLRLALEKRNIPIEPMRQDEEDGGEPEGPDLEDAVMSLEDPTDEKSELTFPVLLLYPLTSQTDLIKQFSERECLNDYLDDILPPPWAQVCESPYPIDDFEELDRRRARRLIRTPLSATTRTALLSAYSADGVECYVVTAEYKLLKVGKNVPFRKVFRTGRVPFVDGLMKINILPRAEAAAWINVFRRKREAMWMSLP